MMTDPISDFLTRIRNAQMMSHEAVKSPSSKMRVCIAELLKNEGYISDFKVEGDSKKTIKVELKYDDNEAPMIEGLKRVSRPGLRVYRRASELPKVRGGLGMAVMSTSKGVMTDADARESKVGGEVLCYIW